MESVQPTGSDARADLVPPVRTNFTADADLAVRQPIVRVAEATPDVVANSNFALDTNGGAKISREHQVQGGNTLWGLARAELKAANQPANGKNIHNYINQIIEANKDHIPSLATNRHKLSIGMKLAMPEIPPGTASPESPGARPGRRRPIEAGEPPVVRRDDEIPFPRRKPDRPVRADQDDPNHPGPPTRPDQQDPARPRPHAAKDSPVNHPLFRPVANPTPEATYASWYGGKFHGRQTANGETYDQDALTVAHKTLPFGTVVRFTNAQGESIDARVTDRGPFVKGRDFDLSRAVARHMGLFDKGHGPLQATILGRGPRSIGGYWRT